MKQLKPSSGAALRLVLVSLALGASVGCDDASKAQPVLRSGQVGDRPLVGFLIENGTYNSELVAPLDVLHHTPSHAPPGLGVCTIAPTRDAITTYEGVRITPDYDYASAPQLEILVVPSAERHVRADFDDPALIGFVRERAAGAKFVLSLCDGAFVLAKARLLDGRRATTFPGDIATLRQRFPAVRVLDNVSFVVDGKFITSVGGAKSYDPALFVVERMFGSDAARGVGRGLVLDWEAKATRFVEFGDSSVRAYRLGDRIDPELYVENADASRTRLLEIPTSDDRVLVLVLFGAAASTGDPPHAGMWCEDSFHELGLFRHAIARFDGVGAAFVAVACPPRYHATRFGFRDGAFHALGDAAERTRFAMLSQDLVALGLLPFPKLHFDFEFRLLRNTEVDPRAENDPDWLGRFRAEDEFQQYGTPTVWILSKDGEILAPPFHANNWEKDTILRHGPRELEAAIERALAVTKP